MSCSQTQVILLLEGLERKLEVKMKQLGLDKETRRQVIMEIERVKQTLIEYGLDELGRQLGI